MSKSTTSSKFTETGPHGPVASPVTRALREVLNGFNDLQRHIAHELDLGLNDVAALEHLIRNPELGPAGIASLLGITTASATVLVDRLENAGHVERPGHPQDRRRKQLVVTEHAQDEVFRALQPLFDIHRDTDQEFSMEEQAVIESYLRRVSQNYRQHVQSDSPMVWGTPTPTL